MPYNIGTMSAAMIPKAWYPVYWLRDGFNIDASAPLSSPRSCDPGPGTLTITDGNNKVSTVGGKLTFATGGVGASNPGIWGTQQTRATGRGIVAILTQLGQNFELGWDNDQLGSNAYDCLRLNTSGSAIREANTAIDVGLALTGGPYIFALIQRGSGFWAMIRGSGIPSWKLIWVGVTGSGNLYPTMQVGSSTTIANVDTIRGLDFGAPFNSDYGFVTQRLSGARAANDIIVCKDSFYVEWTQTTLPASGTTDIRFRVVDSSNYLQATISSTGALTLNTVVAGTPTQIGTAAAAVANGNRVVVTADGSTIRGYSNQVIKVTGSSSSFNTQANGIVSALGTSGAVSDLVSWPIYLDSNMSQMLNMSVNYNG